MTDPQIQKALDAIHKQFGDEAIMSMGANPKEVSCIPTGSLKLDKATGIGGIPLGRITEIYGPEASGKTTICLHCISEAQKLGYNCAFIDAEHALDIKYAKSIGVDIDNVLLSQPSNGEEALEITEQLIRTGAINLIVIDSVAALTPRAEIEGEMGDAHMGLQARLMSQAMRKLTGILAKANCAVVFVNQIRSKIGVMFGSPETTTGGNALKFYASMRLDIRRKKPIKIGETVIGNDVAIKVVKNKLAPPFQVAETCIMYGVGFDKEGELLAASIENGKIISAGAWFKVPVENGEEIKLQGRDKIIEYIREHKEDFE